jgi:hypothetical protein
LFLTRAESGILLLPELQLLTKVIILLVSGWRTQLAASPFLRSVSTLISLSVALTEIEPLSEVASLSEAVVTAVTLLTVVDLELVVPRTITVVICEVCCRTVIAAEAATFPWHARVTKDPTTPLTSGRIVRISKSRNMGLETLIATAARDIRLSRAVRLAAEEEVSHFDNV